tara:strand:+ start:17 stop:2650 length:2634 start_codon:yes stop_codon:yes gene_type:complete
MICDKSTRKYSDVSGAIECKTCVHGKTSKYFPDGCELRKNLNLPRPTNIRLLSISNVTDEQTMSKTATVTTATASNDVVAGDTLLFTSSVFWDIDIDEDVKSYDIVVSTHGDFDNIRQDSTNKNIYLYGIDSTDICVPLSTTGSTGTVSSKMSCSYHNIQSILPLWRTVLYIQIRPVGQADIPGSWSLTSKDWKVASDCSNRTNDAKYLSIGEDGDGLDPKQYECRECPVGGSCDGSVISSGVIAMFAWSQCKGQKNMSFSRCMFEPACLGGTNLALLGKFTINGTIDPARCNHKNCTAHCHEGYVEGSKLCGQCSPNYSHEGLTGKCNLCPSPTVNTWIAVGGTVAGILALFVFVRITIDSHGSLNGSDGVKSIGLSFIQLIALLATFPIAWPPIFIEIFQVGGAITVLGQHLVNVKCMFPSLTDADVFFSIQLIWGVAPLVVLSACVASWFTVDKFMPCFNVSKRNVKIKASCVAIMYMLWPSLCSQAFSMFACRNICTENVSYLRADLDEVCYQDRHLYYTLGVGLPMIFLYIIGLPLLAFVRVRSMIQTKTATDAALISEVDRDNHQIYGLFHSSYREETWWWESTVAFRKIAVALLGVLGTQMESMQIHFTTMFVMCFIVTTAQVRPFGGKKQELLHMLEIFSLVATFLTLWAGSVFNVMPRCEDPEKGDGVTVLWCNMLSIVVGLIDIAFVVTFVACFIYLKVTLVPEKFDDETDGTDGTDGNGEIELRSRSKPRNPALNATEENNNKEDYNFDGVNPAFNAFNQMSKKKNKKEVAINVDPIETKETKEMKETEEIKDTLTTIGTAKNIKNTNAKSSHLRNKTELPEGWSHETTDDNTVYYANRGTQESSWKPPPGSTGGSSGVRRETTIM